MPGNKLIPARLAIACGAILLASCSVLPTRLRLPFSQISTPDAGTAALVLPTSPQTATAELPETSTPSPGAPDPTVTASPVRTRQITEAPPVTASSTLTPTATQTPSLVSPLLFIADGNLKRWDHFTQEVEVLAENVVEYSISENGQKIALLQSSGIAANGVRLFHVAILNLETNQITTIIDETPRIYGLSLSPDGHTIAYTSQENGGTIYALPSEPDAQANKMGECVIEHELECISDITWSPESTALLWSDGRGIWISNLDQATPQLVLSENLEVQDPAGEKNEVQVSFDQLRWSPFGRYALAIVSPVTSDVRWEGIIDTRTSRLSEVPGTYEFKEKSTISTWMPDGNLFVAHRSDMQEKQPPFAELWSVVPTRDELLRLENTFDLPTDGIIINPPFAETNVEYYPKWLAAMNERLVSIGLVPQGDQFSPTLYIYDLKYELLEKVNEIPYATESVLMAPDLSGAVITGQHEEVLFAPADNTPLVDLSLIFGSKVHSLTWLPLESIHP